MLVNGDFKVGEYLTADENIPLVSATDQLEWVELLVKKLHQDLEIFIRVRGK